MIRLIVINKWFFLFKKRNDAMQAINFDYVSTCQVDNEALQSMQYKLKSEIERVCDAHTSHYTTDYASINLPFDQDTIKTVTEMAVKLKKAFNPTVLVVIGIGGSNLGTIAVLESLKGKFYNEHNTIKVYFVDTIDSDHTNDIAQLVKHELTTGSNIFINVVSKSGATMETITNFEIFLKILKIYRPYNYHNFIIATTDKNSALYNLAQNEKFACLIIPNNVGGRYSVFSAVGLFPLCFLDINIEELCEGARTGFLMSTQRKIFDNYAALSASIIATHYIRGKIVHDTFIFSHALQGIGAWYRQLSAESIGKTYDRNNELVNIGILPTISLGSADLHSVAQLYLAGPHNRFTTFISIKKNNSDLVVPNYEEFENIVPHIQNKSLLFLMNAIIEGTKKAYYNDNHPFVSITIPEKSTYYLGQFMQIKMLEIIYLGFILNINPFDQPEVEKYKKETRNILIIKK
ncbi:MAG TPA: hypothetical protein VLB80_05135 [Candidatus Babeliales bacterium]|nr:hypothetical protein [Candidatus Babeliales bacterium]